MSKPRISAVRPNEPSPKDISDPARRIPNHFQEREVAPGFRFCHEEKELCERGSQGTPERDAQTWETAADFRETDREVPLSLAKMISVTMLQQPSLTTWLLLR